MNPGRLIALMAMTAVACLSGAAATASDRAARPMGVVELFTSQGCNSCPRADAFLAELAARGDLVALAYHVDYWDYLGWTDTMASAENSQRQRDYARGFGLGSVYTPQIVVNGRSQHNGNKRASVMSALTEGAGSGGSLSVDIALKRGEDALVIDAGEGEPALGKALVTVVFFSPATNVEIERGKNAGRTITYWNAVTGYQTVGMWHGKPARYELPLVELERKGGAGVAVLLQKMRKDGVPGAVLGAAVLETPGS